MWQHAKLASKTHPWETLCILPEHHAAPTPPPPTSQKTKLMLPKHHASLPPNLPFPSKRPSIFCQNIMRHPPPPPPTSTAPQKTKHNLPEHYATTPFPPPPPCTPPPSPKRPSIFFAAGDVSPLIDNQRTVMGVWWLYINPWCTPCELLGDVQEELMGSFCPNISIVSTMKILAQIVHMFSCNGSTVVLFFQSIWVTYWSI